MDGRAIDKISEDIVKVVLGVEDHAIPNAGKEETVDTKIVRGGYLKWGWLQDVGKDVVWVGGLVSHMAGRRQTDARCRQSGI